MRVPNASLQVPGLVVAYRNQLVVAAPLGLAEPFSVAAVLLIAVAADVTTVGSCVVVKGEKTAP